MPETVTVYFDYLCPFAWRGAEVAEMVASELAIKFVWKHFSLYQNNYQSTSQKNGHWQLWNERIDPADEDGTKGLLPFLASCAARRQGEEAYRAFRLGALRARHQRCQAFTLTQVLHVAREAGLHLPRFEEDLANPECRTMLAKEHYQAAALNVFGTPTFHFSSGHLAYFRLAKLPERARETVELFTDYKKLLETYPYLETIKRPRVRGN